MTTKMTNGGDTSARSVPIPISISASVPDREEDYTDIDELDENLTTSSVDERNRQFRPPSLRARTSSSSATFRSRRPPANRTWSERNGAIYSRLGTRRVDSSDSFTKHSGGGSAVYDERGAKTPIASNHTRRNTNEPSSRSSNATPDLSSGIPLTLPSSPHTPSTIHQNSRPGSAAMKRPHTTGETGFPITSPSQQHARRDRWSANTSLDVFDYFDTHRRYSDDEMIGNGNGHDSVQEEDHEADEDDYPSLTNLGSQLPILSRTTTYSSLPPSPTEIVPSFFDFPGRQDSILSSHPDLSVGMTRSFSGTNFEKRVKKRSRSASVAETAAAGASEGSGCPMTSRNVTGLTRVGKAYSPSPPFRGSQLQAHSQSPSKSEVQLPVHLLPATNSEQPPSAQDGPKRNVKPNLRVFSLPTELIRELSDHDVPSSMPEMRRQDSRTSQSSQLDGTRARTEPERSTSDDQDEIEVDSSSTNPDVPIISPRNGTKSESLWEMLKEEITNEEHTEFKIDGKWERISNFLAIPAAIEKITLFGALVCLDSFLHNFTLLPLRASIATISILKDSISKRTISSPSYSHLQGILRLLLVLIPTVVLVMTTDASKMYHTVRGQDTIKLYVIFNSLEIGDKLCGAFGQDILDTLFARETLDPSLWPTRTTFENDSSRTSKIRHRKRERARPFFFFLLALAYVHLHALVFFYQLVSLNVAINSYDNALLTLLVSNQFVEIKGSVFKKFEKENLFQIMCADIVERFQLSLMLTVISIRNTIEMAGSEFAFLPKSYSKGKSLLETIMSPVTAVILSELAVDWLKHGFITKFNHVRTSIYERYTDVLCKDLILAGAFTGGGGAGKRKRHALFVDRSPLVSRRLGFAALPLTCLVLRVIIQSIGMFTVPRDHSELFNDGHPERWAMTFLKWTGVILICLISWASLVAFKIILGLNLLAFASRRQAGMQKREEEDAINDFGRPPIAVSRQEKAHDKETSEYLRRATDDLPQPEDVRRPRMPPPSLPRRPTNKTIRRDSRVNSLIEDTSVSGNASTSTKAAADKKKWKLEDVERWTMVKRIY